MINLQKNTQLMGSRFWGLGQPNLLRVILANVASIRSNFFNIFTPCIQVKTSAFTLLTRITHTSSTLNGALTNVLGWK